MERVKENEIQWDYSVVLCFHNYSPGSWWRTEVRVESEGESEENGRIRRESPSEIGVGGGGKTLGEHFC